MLESGVRMAIGEDARRLGQVVGEDDGNDTGWRLRQFFKASYALLGNPHVSLVGYDELFFGLNNTDWGATSGFDRN